VRCKNKFFVATLATILPHLLRNWCQVLHYPLQLQCYSVFGFLYVFYVLCVCVFFADIDQDTADNSVYVSQYIAYDEENVSTK
jgi:hypothetical protein